MTMAIVAYLECPTGIAGDMCLGALIHAGVPVEYLTTHLNRLGIANEYNLWAELVDRNGQQATKAHVDIHLAAHGESFVAEDGSDLHPTFRTAHSHGTTHSHAHAHSHSHGTTHNHTHSHAHSHAQTNSHSHSRNLTNIEQLIVAAGLPARAEAWSLAVFRELAIAEAAVHGVAVEQVHFHEVGATDAIVDIVGTCLGLDWLKVDHIICSPLPVGGGTFQASHGRLPSPSPAVLKLWETHQVPVYSNGIDRELVTPTGAAIAVTLAAHFGAPPAMTLQKVGLGAGSRQLPMPNILRLWLGETTTLPSPHAHPSQQSNKPPASDPPHPSTATQPPYQSAIQSHQSQTTTACATTACATTHTDTVVVLETQVDDLNPQAIGYLFDALLTAGALDVFTQAVGMKKSRPGVLITVICRPGQVDVCETLLFQETSTLGIRRYTQQRHILQRDWHTVQTDYGTVRVKVAWDNDPHQILNVQPEYDDCAQLARQHQIPWRDVHTQALRSWWASNGNANANANLTN